jgi:hypothetical protein
MANPIVKLTRNGRDIYFIWSSIADAPMTKGMSLEELEEYVEHYQGQNGLDELPARLVRVALRGHSAMDEGGDHSCKSGEEYVAFNRAGPRESRLSVDQLWDLLTKTEGTP